jgi:glutaconyl-CoA/methylmalonyl-CoA decarboxylase subunit gamma
MQKNFRITVDGRSYNVVVEDLDHFAAPVHTPAASVHVPAAPPAPARVPPPAATSPSPTAGSITAPLGGVVFSIDVILGRDVVVGDQVATIEAMKMKTEVRSKVAGRVTGITAKVNESVETGQVLMTVG